MGLRITRLRLSGFRSYDSLELEPDPRLTVLVGPNAAGKTNIVEALELVTAARSFRRPSWRDVVKWGAEEARLELSAQGDGRLVETAMRATAGGRREYRVNGKSCRRVHEVAGILPAVVFTPDDLRIVKDSADKRRAAVDGVGDQLSAAYRAARVEYEHVLRQRNALLRADGGLDETLPAWTERLIEAGVSFGGHRRRLFKRVSESMSELYSMLSGGESLVTEYQPSWGADDGGGTDLHGEMRRIVQGRQNEEIRRGISLVGPHRDDIALSIEGHDARSFASQGQQRTLALAWKLAEVGTIAEIGGQPPVLLLDDVMSELDGTRRHALAEFVEGTVQTLVTTTNLGYFEQGLVDQAKVVSLA